MPEGILFSLAEMAHSGRIYGFHRCFPSEFDVVVLGDVADELGDRAGDGAGAGFHRMDARSDAAGVAIEAELIAHVELRPVEREAKRS